jgi:hypothetical protein
MASYEHKVKNIYLWSPYNEWQPLIPGDYTLLRWPCDEGFHVPLKEEWKAIIDTWLEATPLANKLHIPADLWKCDWTDAERRDSASNSYQAELWTSSLQTGGSPLIFVYWTAGIYDTKKLYFTNTWNDAYRIRPFRNMPILPDNTRTETETWIIRYNQDLWLITVLVWTDQYVTLKDKDVGAIDSSSRWKYFQRWNNYWFTRGDTLTTSSTQIDASAYWPTNPYSSSTFITWRSIFRDNPRNYNLRWYTDFNS